MEERKLNEKESLELITRMIKNTQQNIEVGGGNQFIVWGVSILVTSVIVGILIILTGNMVFNFAWFLIPIIGYTWNGTLKKDEKILTHIDKMLKTTWMVCGMFCVAIPFIATLLSYFSENYLIFKNGEIFTLIPIIEIIVVSLGIAVTGIIINSKSIRVAGFIGLCISFLTLLHIPYAIQLTFAIWAIACLIIPGVKLNHEIKESKQC